LYLREELSSRYVLDIGRALNLINSLGDATMIYTDFLKTKNDYGFTSSINDSEINPILFDYQKDIVRWALRRGRCAVFADCGLGKTFIQVEFAKNLLQHIEKKIIIFAPLSVNEQTIQESKKLDIQITRFDKHDDCRIKIANYENIEHLNPDDYEGIIIDESSILKSVDSRTRARLIDFSRNIKYRMACTATPAPNDISEIANHTEFLGIMKREEMLSKWFYNNGKDWNLKGHAVDKFYEWMATWAMFMTKPSDLGYSDDGFILPELTIKPLYVDFEFKKDDELFASTLSGIGDRIKIKKESVQIKAQKVAEIVNKSKEQWIIWCGIDLESDIMENIIDGAVNCKGSDSNEEKIEKIMNFKNGKTRVLVTKSKIAGFGMNFQNSHNMLFFGMSDSYEAYYQCIRRQYRFGQKKPVNVIICLAGNESVILNNVLHKETESRRIAENVIKHIKIFEQKEMKGQGHTKMEYKKEVKEGDNYTLYLGDSCEVMKDLNSDSVDFSIFSPPFASLYTYSNSERDLGNCRNDDEFFTHFGFIINELLRITKTGRNVSVHCMNLPTRMMVDGFIGIRDFRGEIIKAFVSAGFIYHSEVTIDKNPQIAAIRTHAKGLMFKQMHKDSSDSRMGLADYIVTFKKPGENKVPIIPDLSNDEWITFAHPVWYDIRETDTLNSVKADKDEKHICPLQLDTIERLIHLYSNKGDTIFTPFMGIGSEVYQAVKMERKGIGFELKESYFDLAKANVRMAVGAKAQTQLTF